MISLEFPILVVSRENGELFVATQFVSDHVSSLDKSGCNVEVFSFSMSFFRDCISASEAFFITCISC